MTFSRALFNLGAVLLVGAWILSGPSAIARTMSRNQPVPLLAVAMFGWIAVSATYSASPASEAWRQAASYSDLLFIPLISAFIRTDRSLLAFLSSIGFSLIALLFSILGFLAFSQAQHNPGIFTNHIVEGFSLAILCLCALFFGLNQQHRSLTHRLISFLIALVTAYTVYFLNPGRAAQLALGVSLFILLIMSPAIHKHIIRAGLISLLAVLLVAQSNLVQTRFDQAIDEAKAFESNKNTSVGLRLNAWIASYELWAESPLLGHGAASYKTLMHSEKSTLVGGCRQGNNPVCLQPHNQFFLFAVEQGLVGVFLFIALLLAAAWTATAGAASIRSLTAAVIACFCIHAFFDSGLRMGYQSFTFVVMIAALERLVALKKSNHNPF